MATGRQARQRPEPVRPRAAFTGETDLNYLRPAIPSPSQTGIMPATRCVTVPGSLGNTSGIRASTRALPRGVAPALIALDLVVARSIAASGQGHVRSIS